jgi:uncharacterized membrane protein
MRAVKKTYKTLHDQLWWWHPHVRTSDDLTFGERMADRMKTRLATFSALIAVLFFITAWMIWNSHLSLQKHHFDPYPWILLNLCLSCFAALQCFILLIANKRGEQIAAELAKHTYELTQKNKQLLEENTRLTQEVHEQTRQLGEIHKHITAVTNHLSIKAGDFAPEVGNG